jgi:peroxiredoxin (alkyl hydroperoxide reductase subunit C)
VTVIGAGEKAPAFSLMREDDEPFTQEDLLGKRTLLVFYPYAFSEVCTDQLNLYDELREEFGEHGVKLYGVSCDASYSQKAFRKQLGVSIEQLSDFEPKGATCRAFDAYHPEGCAQRALVLLGPDGTIEWSYQAASLGELPGANLIFDALAR